MKSILCASAINQLDATDFYNSMPFFHFQAGGFSV